MLRVFLLTILSSDPILGPIGSFSALLGPILTSRTPKRIFEDILLYTGIFFLHILEQLETLLANILLIFCLLIFFPHTECIVQRYIVLIVFFSVETKRKSQPREVKFCN